MCVGWIVRVAEWGADLPAPSIRWGSGVLALAVLVALCLVVGFAAPALLRRRRLGVALVVGSLIVVLGVPGRIASLPGGWPRRLAARAAGSSPSATSGRETPWRSRSRRGRRSSSTPARIPTSSTAASTGLGVTVVPLLVLTHFHADHVAGLPGVLRGRTVGAVEASPMLDPPDAVEAVERIGGRDGDPGHARRRTASTRQYGDVTLQVLWPDLPTPVAGPGDGSAANDASVVLLVESHGLRMLLTGDVEPLGQARLAAEPAGPRPRRAQGAAPRQHAIRTPTG